MTAAHARTTTCGEIAGQGGGQGTLFVWDVACAVCVLWGRRVCVCGGGGGRGQNCAVLLDGSSLMHCSQSRSWSHPTHTAQPPFLPCAPLPCRSLPMPAPACRTPRPVLSCPALPCPRAAPHLVLLLQRLLSMNGLGHHVPARGATPPQVTHACAVVSNTPRNGPSTHAGCCCSHAGATAPAERREGEAPMGSPHPP